VASAAGEVASDIGSAVSGAAKAVGGAVSDVVTEVEGAVSSGIGAVKGWIESVGDGGPNEPGVALLVNGKYVGDVLNWALKEEASDAFVPAEALEAPLAEGETVALGGMELAGEEVEVLVTLPEVIGPVVPLGVAVPAIGVGVLLGAGVVAAPFVIAHAKKVQERLGECGGTLAPGGLEACLEKKKKKCKSCPDGALLDGHGVWGLLDASLQENASRWLGRYDDDELPRTRVQVITDREKFIGVLRKQANAAVLIACPCSGSPLARTEGTRYFDEIIHAEMKALPDLTEEIKTWPEEEREGGALGSVARSKACEEICRPTLQLFQSSVLRGGRFRTERAGAPDNWNERAAEEYNNEWQNRTGRPMPSDWQVVS
jgi:hypothetical protein